MIGQTTEGPASSFRLRKAFRLRRWFPKLWRTSRRDRFRLRYASSFAKAMEHKTARRVFLDRISIFGKAYTFRMDKNTKIVVCGAGGFIGGHSVADLLRQGCANIRAVDVNPASRKPIAGSMTK